MSSAGRRTVRQALAATAPTLGGREAGLLLAHALGTSRERLYEMADRPLPASRIAKFGRLAAARRRGLPLAYLTGTAGFWDMELAVGPGVLIPRPDTETLVEAAIAELAACQGTTPVQVADVGTGTGAIGLAVSRSVPSATVYLTDRSTRALWFAQHNANRWAPHVRVLPAGDLVRPLEHAGVKVQMLLMNPPYLTCHEITKVAREVHHEPKLALDGGRAGLLFYRRLASEVPDVLVAGRGKLIVEIGCGQATAVLRVFEGAGWQIDRVLRDAAGISRVVVASR